MIPVNLWFDMYIVVAAMAERPMYRGYDIAAEIFTAVGLKSVP